MLGKKLYLLGDTVLEGAVLDAIFADRVVFRDADGHRLERRFR